MSSHIKLSISSIQGSLFFVKYRQLSPERDRNQHRVFSHHQPLIVLSQQWRTCRDFRPGERQWLIASTSTSSERAYNLLSTVTFYWFPRWSICRAIATRSTLSAASPQLFMVTGITEITFFSAIVLNPYDVSSTISFQHWCYLDCKVSFLNNLHLVKSISVLLYLISTSLQCLLPHSTAMLQKEMISVTFKINTRVTNNLHL